MTNFMKQLSPGMSRWETTGFLSGFGCGEALICHYGAGSGGLRDGTLLIPCVS